MANISTEDFFIKVAGHNLAVRRLQPESAKASNRPVLLFLHEGLGSIDLWRDFPNRLVAATGCQALIYDRLGHGVSDSLREPRTVDYHRLEALEYLPEVLRQCDISKVVPIGHSDGGTIALLFAAHHPDLVQGLATEAAHVFVEQASLQGIRQAVIAFETGGLKSRLEKYHRANTEGMFRAWSDTWLADDFRTWNIESELASIRCPVLVIQGEEDEYGTPAQVRAIADQVSGPSQTLMIPGCGHIPHLQAGEVVLEHLVRFIQGL